MSKLRIESRDEPPAEIELSGSDVTIGRGLGNTLHFRDPWLSRLHARITLRDGRWWLEDLASRNGTLVAGTPINASHQLAPGDVISLGEIRISFLDSGSGAFKVAEQSVALAAKGTVILSPEDLRLDRYQESLKRHQIGYDTADSLFPALNQAASALIAHLAFEELVLHIVDVVLKAVPALRGALLLRADRGQGELAVVARRGYGEGEEVQISRTIIEVVLEGGQAISTLDAQSDARFDAAVSIMLQGIRSIMCVPLVNNDFRVIGLIYLDDRLTNQVFSENALRLVGLIANMAAVKIENCFLLEDQLEKRRMEEQLAVGSQIQRGLLPASVPVLPGYEICADYQSCFEVSGDYYDFIAKEDGKMAIVVADIAGKGVGAALLMAVLQASLRALVNTIKDPAELVQRLNRVLCESSPSNKFATLFYGELDASNHRFEYVSGGHNPTLLALGDRIELLKSSGPVVGLVLNAKFTSHAVDLPPGALLVLYTDGVTELSDGTDEEFGTERLIEAVQHQKGADSRQIVDLIHDRMVAFAQSNRFDDDCTLVVVRRLVL